MSPFLRARLAWLGLFAAAFGYVEAVVVVYLRRIAYPDGFRFPIHVLGPGDPIAVTEVAREAATLLMLLGVAGLAAQTSWGRLGAFAYAFGIWDIVYYVGLEATIGWPGSLATWDVLFLIPGIWSGPVWSAVVVATLFVVCGASMVRDESGGLVPRPGPLPWALAGLSFALLLAAFLWNHGPVSRGEMHGAFPWPLWTGGVVAGLSGFLLTRGSSRRPVCPPGRSGRPAADRSRTR